MKGKIKQLLEAIPNNTVATTPWLAEQGISAQLRKKYVNSGWLKAMGYGAYSKLSDKPSVLGGIFALQHQLKLDIHVGALSALELKNGTHYVTKNLSERPMYLFSHAKRRAAQLPKWFKVNYPLHTKYDRKLFNSPIGIEGYSMEEFSIKIASTERALFEILSLVPEVVDFEYASLLFEGKEFLRPKLVQHLLETCRIQVLKRIYLYFLDIHNLSIKNKLDLTKINLGRGRRVVANGTFYNRKYDLMLPTLVKDEDIPI